MKKNKNKICEVCNDSFPPDHRVGDRQRVCDKKSCKKERKRRAQQAWLNKNPGYFKGRYPQLKEKLKKQAKSNQGKVYHIQNKINSTMSNESFNIQDEIINNKNKTLTISKNIQDEITSKISNIKQQLSELIVLIYKTSESTVI